VAYYTLGWSSLNLVDWTIGGWVVWYQSCGIPGQGVERPFADTGWGLNASPTQYGGALTGEISCPVNSNAIFNFTFNPTSVSPAHGLAGAEGFSLKIGLGAASETQIINQTANSLSAWMVDLDIHSPGGSVVAPSGTGCPTTADGIGSCSAPTSGWYAVLLSPVGWLLDSYPSGSGGGNWTLPNVSVVNNDTLVIVPSLNLNLTGDTLDIGPSGSLPLVTGSVSLS